MSVKILFGNMVARKTYLYVSICIAVILTPMITLASFLIPVTTYAAQDCGAGGYLVDDKCIFFSKGDDVYSEQGCIESKAPYPGYKSIPCPNELIDVLEQENADILAEEQAKQEEENRLEDERVELIVERKLQELAVEERQSEINNALDNCDLDFFDSITTSEKMDTYNEREACKAKDVIETTSEPVTAPTQTIQPKPQNPAVTTSLSAPTATQTDNINIETEQAEETSTTSTTPSETVEQTKSVADETEVAFIPEPEKPTFFQRVIRFFTGWFK